MEGIYSKVKSTGYVMLAIYCLFCAVSRTVSHISVGVLIVLTIVSVGLSIKKCENRLLFWGNIKEKGICWFLIGCAVSIFVSNDLMESLRSLSRLVLYFMPLLFVDLFIDNKEQLNRLICFFAMSVIIGGSIAIVQGFQGMNRATGFVGIMDLGGILGMLVPMMGVLAAQMHQQGEPKKKLLFSIAMLIGLGALLANGTRINWIATVICFVAFFSYHFPLFSHRQLLMVGFLFLGVIIIAAFDSYVVERFLKLFTIDGDSSNYKRIAMWKYGWGVFQEYPLLGVGLGVLPAISFGNIPGEYLLLNKSGIYGHVHSVYLQLMATTGIIGLVSYFYFMYRLLKKTYVENLSRLKLNYATAIFAIWLAFMIHGFTDYVLGIGTVVYAFSTLIAILIRCNRIS